jgi:hypothetical protein
MHQGIRTGLAPIDSNVQFAAGLEFGPANFGVNTQSDLSGMAQWQPEPVQRSASDLRLTLNDTGLREWRRRTQRT